MIKIGKNHIVKYSGIKNEIMAELATIISELRQDMTEEEIKMCCKIGLSTFEESKSVYKIEGDSKEELIKQVKRLELPKYVEKAILEELKNC